MRPEILDLEQRADLPARALGNDERPWLGEHLQPGGQVRGLTDYAALLCGTRADQIADHDQAAGDAEPHIQRLRRRDPADRVDDGEPGAHRPLGVVLMRLRVAEIDQHAVAHVLGDKTGEAGNRVGDAAMIGADYLAQILGIVAGRQRRRADQIAEHHGELTPLGIAGSGGRHGRGLGDALRHAAAKGGDRGQQFATMTDRRDAEADQIVGGQLRQNLGVDIVGGEGQRILLETERVQPVSHIDGHCRPSPSAYGAAGASDWSIVDP